MCVLWKRMWIDSCVQVTLVVDSKSIFVYGVMETKLWFLSTCLSLLVSHEHQIFFPIGQCMNTTTGQWHIEQNVVKLLTIRTTRQAKMVCTIAKLSIDGVFVSFFFCYKQTVVGLNGIIVDQILAKRVATHMEMHRIQCKSEQIKSRKD